MCCNRFGKFPELGYSDTRGGVASENGFTYDCAASSAWREEQKLMPRVWIIDNHMGNMTAIFSFKDNEVFVRMVSNAENFLSEYQDELVAVLADE